MDVQEIIQLVTNNGTAIAVIAYFIYRDNKFMGTLQTTLQTLIDTVDTLKETITNNIKERND